MQSVKDITKEDLKTRYEHYCTVGTLKKILEEKNVPDDAKIMIQRVEDVYFEKHNWGTRKIPGDLFYSEKRLIDKAKSGEFNNRDNYPNMTPEHIQEILDVEEKLNELLDEYVPAWYPIKHDDDDNIYLTAFY